MPNRAIIERLPQVSSPNLWRRQFGYTGIETVDHLIESREHNLELRPLDARVRAYRIMRADPAIDMALTAGELPILGAHWPIVSEAQADREIVEFLEDAIYPFLDDLLRWMLGMWQYGFATIEPVFAFRDNPAVVFITQGRVQRARRPQEGRVWLDRLIHFVPDSIEGFIPDPLTGELAGVEQNVFIEDVGFLEPLTPGWKVIHTVHNREGSDWTGRAMLRSMFMPWDLKQQMAKGYAVHWDRFGVGTPFVRAGPDWGDAEFDRAEKVLKNYRSGVETFLVIPHGGELTIFAGEEATRGTGPIDFIRYLDGAIAKVALQQMLELGTTASGNRALGESMLDMLEASLQGTAEFLASLIQQKLIVPLVDLNFGERDSYPQLLPAVTIGSTKELIDTIAAAKSAGMVGWTAEDESRIRDVTELPEIDVEARQAEMDEEADLQRQQAEAAIQPQDEERQLAHSPSFQPFEDRPTEALAILERDVVMPRVLADQLDAQLFRVGAEADEVLARFNDELVEQAEALVDAQGAGAAASAGSIAVPDSSARALAVVIRQGAKRAVRFGMQTVHSELERQQDMGLSFTPDEFLPMPPRLSRHYTLQEDLPDPSDIPDLELFGLVEGEIARFADIEIERRNAAARGAMLRALREVGGVVGPILLRAAVRFAVRRALEELSAAVTRGNLEAPMNVAFGVGRNRAAQQLIDDGDIAFGVRSEVLDANTCIVCEGQDGTRIPREELRNVVAPPFPDCLGRERCRGLIVYVRTSEEPALA